MGHGLRMALVTLVCFTPLSEGSCIPVNNASCSFDDTSLCGWTNSNSSLLKWTAEGGDIHLDTTWNVIRSTNRKGHLSSPVICQTEDSKVVVLEFQYRFSGSGGGHLFGEVCGSPCVHIFNIVENDAMWHRKSVNVTLYNKGLYQLIFTGAISRQEKIGSDIYLDEVKLRADDCATPTHTSTALASRVDPTTPSNATDASGGTTCDTTGQKLDKDSDDTRPSSDNTRFDPKKADAQDGGVTDGVRILIIVGACVGSGLAVAGVAVIIVCKLRNRAADREPLQSHARQIARNSSIMVENELYNITDFANNTAVTNADAGKPVDTTPLHSRAPARLSLAPPGPGPGTDDRCYSTLRHDRGPTATHAPAPAGRDATPEYAAPAARTLPVLSLNPAPLPKDDGDGLAESSTTRPPHTGHESGVGDVDGQAEGHEYESVRDGGDDGEGDNDDPGNHYALINDSSCERHLYSNEAGSFDGASIMTLCSQDDMLSASAADTTDSAQPAESVYDVISSPTL